MRDLRNQAIDDEFVVAVVLPGFTFRGLLEQRQELVVTPVALQLALQRRNLEIARVAGPLQHLVEQHFGHFRHGGTGDLLARQVEHEHGGGEAFGNGGEQRLGGGALEPVLQVLDEGYAVDRDAIVEGQAQVLGEGAFARAIEAGDPDADFILAADIHRGFHLQQQVLELLVDALGDHVFGDFRLQSGLLRNAIGDDLLDVAMDILARVEQLSDLHLVFQVSTANMH
jgi:hypothetical protein